MNVIIDTNFVISCILKKIDFISELEKLGFKVLVPREMLQEMKDLKKNGKTSRQERVAIDLAQELLNEKGIKKITFGQGRLDVFLIERGKKGDYIATLDSGIKRMVPNRVVINSAKNGLMVERLSFSK
jgi:rRNA-processing protein FCF1